ncbi:MFS transporter [Dapis sp. BLCC M229]|uniref:MFS transporter n=1 Tax=Dapis sp. BLCC M229 TaxID=3400188 RepID=UPI003CF19F9E
MLKVVKPVYNVVKPVYNGEIATKWKVLIGIGMGVFMFGLEVNIVNLALPELVKSLHTNFSTIQWVVLSYLLMLTVMVLFAARLGDIWSKKRLYLGGLILFTIASLLCGLAQTVGFLIAWRAFQGLGAVFMSALFPAIITEAFPTEERGQGLGIVAWIFNLGIALGPTVGGLLMALSNWRLIFLVNVPLGLIASLIVALVVPSSGNDRVTSQPDISNCSVQQSIDFAQTQRENPLGKFDVLGGLLVTLALICFAFDMTLFQREGFGSSKELVILAIATIALTCFLITETRSKNPMIDLKIFRSLQFSLNLLLNLIFYIVLGAVIFVLPFFLESVKEYPTQQAGLLMAVIPTLSGPAAFVAGTLSDRFGSRTISLIGLMLIVGGCLSLSTISSELTWLGYIMRVVPFGLGVGIFISPNNSAVMGAVPQENLGIGSGLLSLSRTLGQIIGLPLMGAMLSIFTKTVSTVEMSNEASPLSRDIANAPPEILVEGMQTSFRVVGIILIVSVILVSVLWWLEHEKEH